MQSKCRSNFCPHTPPSQAKARLQGLYGALRTVLDLDARGMLERDPRTGQAWPASSFTTASPAISYLKSAVYYLATIVMCDAGLLLRMRAECGLSAAEEMALRRLAERHKAAMAELSTQELQSELGEINARRKQTAAADAARHGLRRCALPSCDAQEPHPKLFKLCGRCRGAAYCCAAHSVEDWKRHKREDGCKAAP
jgi:hypothetical protein